MASNECRHDPKITEFIEARQSGIDLTQRTDYFTKDLLKYTRFIPNSFNLDDEGNSYEGNYSVTKPMVYFLYVMLLNCVPVLIYVGKTKNGSDRIFQHEKDGKPFDCWRYIPTPPYMLNNVEEYYIRTCKPVLNLIKNPLYMLDNEKYRISKANFNAYSNELKQHILQILDSLEQKQIPPDLIVPNSKPPAFNFIPKELERKYFDL